MNKKCDAAKQNNYSRYQMSKQESDVTYNIHELYDDNCKNRCDRDCVHFKNMRYDWKHVTTWAYDLSFFPLPLLHEKPKEQVKHRWGIYRISISIRNFHIPLSLLPS